MFGGIVDGAMQSNPLGQIVQACWEDLPRHYSHVELDAFTVMPNHVHGIILIHDDHTPSTVGAGLKPALTQSANAEQRAGLKPAPTT